MQNYHYTTRRPFEGPHLLGSLLIVAGILALVSLVIFEIGVSIERVLAVGIGAILLGLFILNTYSGTLIDFSQNAFKEYQSIAGFKKGDWQDLPQIDIVSIRKKTYHSRNTPNGISPTLSGKVTVFEIRLQNEERKTVFSFSYANQAKAEKQARILAKGLGAEMSDDWTDQPPC